MKKLKSFYLFISVISLVFLSGCGGNSLQGLVPGHGQLTFNGEAVESATVVFSPLKTSSGESRAASAITDAKGYFKLMTLDPEDGVFPGEYVVTITKVKTEGGPSEKELLENFGRYEGPDDRKITYLVPEKYGHTSESGLEVTIPPKGKKDILIELTGTISGNAIPIQQIRR